MRFAGLLALSAAVSPTALAAQAAPTDSGAPPPVQAQVMGPALRSTDLDRSARFYTAGLGMVVRSRRKSGEATELILGFEGKRAGPVIMLVKREDNRPAAPIVHGDGYRRTMIAVGDAEGLAKRLRDAGYDPSPVRANAAVKVKVFTVNDPDGYAYEVVEREQAAAKSSGAGG